MFSEDELLPISALQHFLFCRRRAALVHIEGLWAENQFTVEGTQLHTRADNPRESQKLATVRIERAVGLCSYRWGLAGKADVVEFRQVEKSALPEVTIVEYKRGKPKKRLDHPFHVQLCAQALCIEDMLLCSVESGAIYYGKSRQRIVVAMDAALRAATETAIADLHHLIGSRNTPLPNYQPRKCQRCSLFNLCLPHAPRPVATGQRYLRGIISEPLDVNEAET